MAKSKVRLKKDNDIRQRLLNIEIDEISLVDKPAIEDEFIITKRVNGKKTKGGITVAKKKKKTKTVAPVKTVKTAKEIQKGVFWKRAFKKDSEKRDHGEHCGFCGITKADETETIGMGLRCGVCFKCAVQHMEKDVIEDCVDGNFNFDKFKEKYPEVKLHSKEEPPAEDDDEDEETEAEKTARLEAEEKAKADAKDSEDEDSEDEDSEDEDSEDEDSEDEDSEDDEAEKAKKAKAKDEAAKKKKKNKTSPIARLGKVEKALEDVVEMLAGSMEFHEQAVAMLSAQAELMMGALEMILMGENAEQSDATVQAATDLKDEIKSFRDTVQKAGAKISAGRLSTLRDIAEKLTELIQSVASEESKQGGKKGAKKNRKSFEKTATELEALRKQVESLEKSNLEKDEQLEKLANRLDDFDAFSEGSTEIDDDEDDEDSESSGESVFKDLDVLKPTVDRMEKRTRTRVSIKRGS